MTVESDDINDEIMEAAVELTAEAASEDELEEEIEDSDEDVEDEEDDDDESGELEDPVDRLFLSKIAKNASRNSDKLKVHLASPVVIRLRHADKAFTIDWSKEGISVEKGAVEKPGCLVEISEEHILDIAAGDLNPQVALLSDKVRLEGKMELAIYVFNLIVRKSRR